jgi:hypothetical protein
VSGDRCTDSGWSKLGLAAFWVQFFPLAALPSAVERDRSEFRILPVRPFVLLSFYSSARLGGLFSENVWV